VNLANVRDWTSIEEATGTSYNEERSMCLAFYVHFGAVLLRRKR
jgi:hypothetical protein